MTRLEVIRELDLHCKHCTRFIGPGPMGWCEGHDERQMALGRCDEMQFAYGAVEVSIGGLFSDE